MSLRTLPPAEPSSDYDDYLASAHWQELRIAALTRAGHRCQVCNSTERLQVHHRTYERLGREDNADVTVLCYRCHQTFHAPDDSGRPTRSVERTPTNRFFGILTLALTRVTQDGGGFWCEGAIRYIVYSEGRHPEHDWEELDSLVHFVKAKTHANGTPWGGSTYRRWIEAFKGRPLYRGEQITLSDCLGMTADAVFQGGPGWSSIRPAHATDYRQGE